MYVRRVGIYPSVDIPPTARTMAPYRKACGLGRLRLTATIDRPDVVRRILEHLGLPAEHVRAVSACAPPAHDDMDWGA